MSKPPLMPRGYQWMPPGKCTHPSFWRANPISKNETGERALHLQLGNYNKRKVPVTLATRKPQQ